MAASVAEPFRGRRIAVLGLGVSNRAALRFLLRSGARPTAFDRKGPAELGRLPAELRRQGVALRSGPGYLEGFDPADFDAVVVTPGMRKDLPALAAARQAGLPLFTEAALVLEESPVPVVGVTGSAGKTTTTTMLGRMVRRWRPGSLVGGNIGRPLLDVLHRAPPDGLVVMELSSFQLELAQRSPHAGALLNVRPNHLDVHGTFEAYTDAKRRIYRFQRPGDACAFNLDDPVAASCAAEAPGQALAFSRSGEVQVGAFVRDGWVVCRRGGVATPVVRLEDIRVPGVHNVENILAAAALASFLGVPPPLVASVVRSFRGVEHRLETVAERDGVRWINDSIATAPDRTAAALATCEGPLVLLAGGYDKGLSFDGLAPLIRRRVRLLVLFGATADHIRAAVQAAEGAGPDPAPEVVTVADLGAAVAAAAAGSRPGDTVLLSPACASYDQFRDFAERGRRFKALVRALGA